MCALAPRHSSLYWFTPPEDSEFTCSLLSLSHFIFFLIVRSLVLQSWQLNIRWFGEQRWAASFLLTVTQLILQNGAPGAFQATCRRLSSPQQVGRIAPNLYSHRCSMCWMFTQNGELPPFTCRVSRWDFNKSLVFQIVLKRINLTYDVQIVSLFVGLDRSGFRYPEIARCEHSRLQTACQMCEAAKAKDSIWMSLVWRFSHSFSYMLILDHYHSICWLFAQWSDQSLSQ